MLLLVALGQPASAAEQAAAAPAELVLLGEGSVADLSAAQLEDAKTYARQHDKPLDEVLTGFVGQDEFVKAVNMLQVKFPEVYSSSRWNRASDGRGEISFTEQPPAAALDVIRESGVTVVVRTVGGVSEQKMLASQAAVYKAVYNLPGVANATAGVDPATGTIDVQLSAGGYLDVVSMSALEASASQAARSALLDKALRVNVTYDPKLSGTLQLIRGGMNYGTCTGAFSIRSGSYWGISTAQHCSTTASYDGYSMGSAGRAASASDGDVRWQATAGVGASSAFQYGYGAFRYVTAVLNPVAGDNICKFGRSTGYTCDTTYLVNRCANGYCGVNYTLARQAAPGDSGGPWFNGTTARGIHSGNVTYGGQPRDVYTRIGAVNLISASVITS